MAVADKYRTLASELRAKDQSEQNTQVKAELAHLAMSYLRLATQAEGNAGCDITYEPNFPVGLNQSGGEPA
jgi:hypothetical protein